MNNTQYFVKESQFEQALVDLLPHHGWEKNVLVQPTEEDLIRNWAKILFDNNRDINKYPVHCLIYSRMLKLADKYSVYIIDHLKEYRYPGAATGKQFTVYHIAYRYSYFHRTGCIQFFTYAGYYSRFCNGV